MRRFEGKSIIVTGAGSGIGYAIARAFAHEGGRVALNDLNGELAVRAAQTLNTEVGAAQVTPYVFDVADVAALRHAINDFADKTGRLDVAIANAGLTNYGEFLTYTPEAFDRLTSVNLRGSFFTAQAAALAMIARQIQGRIILMSSGTGELGFPNLHAYGVTKAGIKHMARALAVELGRFGIGVNAIVPGAVVTERTLGDDPEYEAHWGSVSPNLRAGQVEDIAAAALFLALPEARHIHGHALVVDGGWTIQSRLPEGHPAIPPVSGQLR